VPNSPPARRLTLALTLALSLAVLAAALLGPSQTLAQAHRGTCSSSATDSRTKLAAHTCVRPSRKRRGHHATRRRAKHAKKAPKAGTRSPALAAAYCEDGSAPVRAGNGSFSCDDGSEPECEDGSTPTVSRNGKRLVCPVAGEGVGAGEGEAGSSEECQAGEAGEAGAGCGAEAGTASGLPACEAPSSEGSAACEEQS
jgi:hypothetical protein